MMKNRDTASNPYRVPRQPTAQWIKVSIVMLFLCNVALMGSVVYLVFATQQCTNTCYMYGQQAVQNGHKQKSSDVMATDGAQNPIVRQEEIVRLLTRRVDNAVEAVSRLQSTVRNLDELCRKKISANVPKTVDDRLSPDTSLYPRQSNLQEVVAQLQLNVASLGVQLRQYIASTRQVCKKGHYRQGVHCFYVGEAALPQAEAKSLCSDDYHAEGSLVMIKDKFVHDYVSAKLPNRLHSYWIGIERQQMMPDAWSSHSIRSSPKEGKKSDAAPAPLLSDDNAPYAATAQGTAPFDYVDGTKVQNKVWQMWGPRANRHSDDRQNRNCVALTYDRDTQGWHWQDHDCGSRLGYVCQYYIMSVGN